MNELTISAMMQNSNNRRFQELLSEAESERRYRQQMPHRLKLRQWLADRLIAAGRQLKPRQSKVMEPAGACVKVAYLIDAKKGA